ncbi:MAG: carboxypeptidase-like regulatory domain-containing protein [Terracidiphilus sp.]
MRATAFHCEVRGPHCLGLQSLVLMLATACLPALPQTAPAASGTATASGGYRIAGTVVNSATGEPVRGATVAALSEADSHTIAVQETGEDGHFSLAGLAAAKYQLTASRRGFRTAFYDEHEEFSTAIVTGAGQDTEQLTFRLPPGAVVHGVVTGDGGDPVEGARVILFRKPGAHKAADRITQAEETNTDDTGAYEFANLAAGEYLLAVKAEPWFALHGSANRRRVIMSDGAEPNAALDVAYPVTFFDSTTEESAATPIVLASGSREEADINLHATPALHLVVDAPRKADGSIARAELWQTVFGIPISAENSGFMGALRTGSMEFAGLAPGQFELTQGDPPRIAELNLAASQQVEPGIGAPSVAVSGTIRSTDGPVPASATVMLVSADGPLRQNTVQAACIRGAFNFQEVPPGVWKLMVGSLGTGSGNRFRVVATTVDGATHAGDTVTVRDHPLQVQVTVSHVSTEMEGFARRDGKGVAGVMIVLAPKSLGGMKSLARRDQSDSDGSFALRDVGPGQYTVVAIEDGWDLDWEQPDVIRRYLRGGVAVTVLDSAGKLLTLPEAVPVQNRQP